MAENRPGFKEDPDQGLIAIEDEEIDPEEIVNEINRRITLSRSEQAYDEQKLPFYDGATRVHRPDYIPYDIALYNRLDKLTADIAKTGTTLDIPKGSIRHLPVLGQLWKVLQIRLHAPGLHYANRVAERQAEINTQLIEVLNRLLLANQQQQREIKALRELQNRQVKQDN